MDSPPASGPAPAAGTRRDRYRHGDLHRALLEAGVALAAEGGPDAVVLREATRRAGVVPNAAYRHFASRQALLDAVRAIALDRLALAMEREMVVAAQMPEPAARARALLRAVGVAYVGFAQRHPGLFRTAFSNTVVPGGPPSEQPAAVATEPVPDDARPPAAPDAPRRDPLQLLTSALDAMVEAGVLPATRRPGAEYLAWSAVHGFSVFLLNGPLRGATPAERDALGARLLTMVERGL